MRVKTVTRTCMFVFLAGLGLGWIIGLSLSEVVHLVVGGVVGVAAAIISALSGVEVKDSAEETAEHAVILGSRTVKVSALPMAMFLIGIGVAAPFGIVARTHEWFSAKPETIVKAWTNLELTQSEVSRRLFEHTYPISSDRQPHDTLPNAQQDAKPSESHFDDEKAYVGNKGGLYSLSITDREQLLTLDVRTLRNFMTNSPNPLLKEIATAVSDDNTLQQIAQHLADVH